MQVQEHIVQINFIDRLGLGYEIFEIFKNHNINLLATEAKENQNMTIKFRSDDTTPFYHLFSDLRHINGVLSVTTVEQMPYQQRELELKTILNLTDDGIVAINQNGLITHINEAAATIFHLNQDNVTGKYINDFFPNDLPITETLETGQPRNLKEVRITQGRKICHFISSSAPIKDDQNHVIGAVATIKDYRQVEKIISMVEKFHFTTFDDIIYQSPKMKEIVDTARMVAKGGSTILLRGESGTGKELFAKAIHVESNRGITQFIAINCAALPNDLLESELFGYDDGAFTGAAKGGKKGLFEQANGGTLFLDEIGELSPQVQVRLLRVLQENAIRRIGGNREIPVDVRLIAATHRNLEDMIRKDEFREDLYYRLTVIPLVIPPLRERPEDIPLIALHLARKICKKLNRTDISLSEDSIDFLIKQNWPGNVRQLENTLERVINLVHNKELRTSDFRRWTNPEVIKGVISDGEEIQIRIDIGDNCSTLKEMVNDLERQVLIRVLDKYPSSRKAGNVLGVSNTTILNKINSLGIPLRP